MTSTRAPATTGQSRLWVTERIEPDARAYRICRLWRTTTRIELASFDDALRLLSSRHEALRSSLHWEAGELWQLVHGVVDGIRHVGAWGDDSELAAELERLAEDRFDLEAAPLIRWFFANSGEGTAIGFVCHHAICDSWSISLLLQDLCLALEGQSLPPAVGQPREVAARERLWLGTADADDARAWWSERLADPPPPLDFGAMSPLPSRKAEVAAFRVARRQIDGLASSLAVTPNAVLFGALAACIHRYTRNDDMVIAVPVSGRYSTADDAVVGYLSNTVLVRVALSARDPLADVARRSADELWAAFCHGRLPLFEIVSASALARSPAQVMFGPQESAVDRDFAVGGAPLVAIRVSAGGTPSDLTISTTPTPQRWDVLVEHDVERYGEGWGSRFAEAFEALLRGAAADADTPVGQLPLLANPALPRDPVEPPSDLEPAYASFARQVQRHPSYTAIRFGEQSLSYEELASRAEHAAAELATCSAGTNVGIQLDRGIELIVAVLGCLRAGVPFVPIDPRYPSARVKAICAIAEVLMIIRRDERADGLATILPDWSGRLDDISREAPGLDELAYVYSTSGSTGQPKGVAIDQRCLMTRLAYLRQSFDLAPGDRLLHKTPLVFDIAIWEILLPLFAGATIEVAEPGGEADIPYLGELLSSDGMVLADFVPSLLHEYLQATSERTYPSLRRIVVSGEAVSDELLSRAESHFGCAVVSQYGQTETAEVTEWALDSRDRLSSTPVIGRPVGPFAVYVVDDAGKLVGDDAVGQIAVSGEGGLAWGYQKDPRMTAARFVPHPNPATPGQRMYLTGDLGRRRRDGRIEFLGRTDRMVKLRGCRIELADVERFFNEQEGVDRALACVRTLFSRDALVVYVVSAAADLDVAELLAAARASLPWYLVPSHVIPVEALPTTSSGKADYGALPQPAEVDATPWEAVDAPRGPLEEALAAAWEIVLGRPPRSRSSDFVSEGGSSLDAVRFLTRVEATFGVRMALRDFWELPTVAACASSIEQELHQLVQGLTIEEVETWLDAVAPPD